MKGDAEQSNMDKSLEQQREMQREQIESAEKMAEANRASALEQARMATEESKRKSEAREKQAAAELEFGKEKFQKEFQESIYRDRTEREEAEAARLRSESGLAAGSQFVVGASQTVSPVEVSRRRKALTKPSWLASGPTTATTTSSAVEAGLTPGGAPTPGQPGSSGPGLVGVA